MFSFFLRPDFWIGYLVLAGLFVGVFFCVLGYHRWYREWRSSDVESWFPRVVGSIFFGAIFPITIAFYASMLVGMYISSKVEGQAKSKDKVRCYSCGQPIFISDSFCPLCGADQTKLKKD